MAIDNGRRTAMLARLCVVIARMVRRLAAVIERARRNEVPTASRSKLYVRLLSAGPNPRLGQGCADASQTDASQTDASEIMEAIHGVLPSAVEFVLAPPGAALILPPTLSADRGAISGKLSARPPLFKSTRYACCG